MLDQEITDSSSSAIDSSSQEFNKIIEIYGRLLAHLPQPEATQGILIKARSAGLKEARQIERSVSASFDSSPVYTIDKFFCDRSSSLSSAITKYISALAEPSSPSSSVTEFRLSSLKVIVKVKKEDDKLNHSNSYIKGRISFFSRSAYRDYIAVWAFSAISASGAWRSTSMCFRRSSWSMRWSKLLGY